MSKSEDVTLEYIRGDKEGEIIVITHGPGSKRVRTIVKTFPAGTVGQPAPTKKAAAKGDVLQK